MGGWWTPSPIDGVCFEPPGVIWVTKPWREILEEYGGNTGDFPDRPSGFAHSNTLQTLVPLSP